MNLPDYNRYKHFGPLCEVPNDILTNLQEYFNRIQDTTNDPTYSKYLGYGGSEYQQWYVQKSSATNNYLETAYTQWRDDNFLKPSKDFFLNYVRQILRFRFSLLAKNDVIDYHGKHLIPRIHIPLSKSSSTFVINEQDIEHFYEIEYGKAYFINVTLLHRIISSKDMDRTNCFFSFTHFKDEKITAQFLK